MFELFSDIFTSRDNFFTRIDSRVKLASSAVLIVTVLLCAKVYFPLSVLVFCLLSMILIGLPVRLILLRLAGPIGIVCVLVVLQTFLSGNDTLFAIDLLHWKFIATRDGLMRGIVMGSRVLGAVSVILLLSSVTPAHKIFNSMRWFGIPEAWVEIALLVYRYTFSLLDQTSDVISAQSTRLGYSDLRKSLNSIGVLAGTVVTRSMDQAMRTYEAMTLRGYGGSMPFGPLPRLTTADFRDLLLALPLIIGIFLMMERYTV